VPTGITFYNEKEAREYARGLEKQGWRAVIRRGQDPQGGKIWVVKVFGTTRTMGRSAPQSLEALYTEEETKAQRLTLPPNLARMKPEKLAGVLTKEAEDKERAIKRIEKRLTGVKSPEKRRDIAEEIALMRAQPSVVERAILEEQQKLARLKPEERVKRIAEAIRQGVAISEVARLEDELEQKEAIAREMEQWGMIEGKPLIPRLAEEAKLGKRLKVPAQFAKTGVKAAREAGSMAKEAVSPKTLGAVGKRFERQASMRKAIPVSAELAQRQGKGYIYLARIGKVGTPAISEVSYPTQNTIAQAPMQERIASVSRASIAEAPSAEASTSIVYRPQKPRIAELTPLKKTSSIASMPYLKEREEEDEESSGNQPA